MSRRVGTLKQNCRAYLLEVNDERELGMSRATIEREAEDMAEVLTQARAAYMREEFSSEPDDELQEVEESPQSEEEGRVDPPMGPRPGVFDLRKQLGRAPTAQEYRDSRS